MLLDEKKYILNLSLNKNNINFYRCNDKIFMKIDNIQGTIVKGLYIKNDIIVTKIILNNNFIYLPDITYNTNKDLLTAIINRDIYIETLSNINKDISNNLLRKKNLPVKCINNKNIIELINDT